MMRPMGGGIDQSMRNMDPEFRVEQDPAKRRNNAWRLFTPMEAQGGGDPYASFADALGSEEGPAVADHSGLRGRLESEQADIRRRQRGGQQVSDADMMALAATDDRPKFFGRF